MTEQGQLFKPTRSRVERLFADYNEYWFQTASVQKRRQEVPYLRGLKLNAERKKLFADMVTWCDERGLEPRLWLYSLFRSRRWMFPPKLHPGVLMTKNEKMIRAYHTIKGLGLFRREMVDARHLQEPAFDPNRDMNPTVEAIKKRYVLGSRAGECMHNMVETTLGYHPLSDACTVCPIAEECRERLIAFVEFDIMGLRLGKISPAQAQAEVRKKRR